MQIIHLNVGQGSPALLSLEALSAEALAQAQQTGTTPARRQENTHGHRHLQQYLQTRPQSPRKDQPTAVSRVWNRP